MASGNGFLPALEVLYSTFFDTIVSGTHILLALKDLGLGPKLSPS